MGRIRILPEDVVSQIAAGEVIERPASVVKELIENSIDAGAGKVEIYLIDGGLRHIRVTDDGEGMDREDAILAFERHATSKLTDLHSIGTMGFRGEALASIASVAEVILTTKRRGEETGTRVRIDGRGQTVEEVGTIEGTSVEVNRLFFNIPARRKFLKSPSTELNHIMDVVYRYVLSHPSLAFKVYHNRRSLINLPQRDRVDKRVEDLFGRDVSKGLVTFEGHEGKVSLRGYLHTEELREKNSISIYVNRRWIRDRVVTRALMDALHGVIPKGRYPFAIIYLDLPPEHVDVNVHPTKTEVRFGDPHLIYKLVRSSVEKAIRDGKKEAPVIPVVKERPPAYQGKTEPLPLMGILEEEDSGVRIIGQLWKEFILCEDEKNLYLIDQHAAHERIAFERLKKEYREKGFLRPEPLVVPHILSLDPRERVCLEEAGDIFTRLGLELEAFGGGDYRVRSIPWILKGRDYKRWIRDLLSEPSISREGLSERLIDELLMSMACHSVVRGKEGLHREEIRTLLRDLQDATTYRCPHGRPVVKVFSRSEVERFFGR